MTAMSKLAILINPISWYPHGRDWICCRLPKPIGFWIKDMDLRLSMALRAVASALRTFYHKRHQTARRLLKGRKDRNQWAIEFTTNLHLDHMKLDGWDDMQAAHGAFYARVKAALPYIRGDVLEIGCACGLMTRWIAKSEEVCSVLAVDAFDKAIELLEGFRIPKVETLVSDVQDLQLPAGRRFDTVVICEVLEHLYADEERRMLERLRLAVGDDSRYVVSVPIGWQEDPCHVRAFSKGDFVRHLEILYGPVYSITQVWRPRKMQTAYGYWCVE